LKALTANAPEQEALFLFVQSALKAIYCMKKIHLLLKKFPLGPIVVISKSIDAKEISHMAMNNKGLNAYRNVHVSSAVQYADGIQLIQMLFDGLIETLASAEGHIERKNIAEKCRVLNRASGIIYGLQDSLDFNKGTDLARNLSDLYDYMIRRLLFANLHNDVNAIREVKGLANEIRSAWELLPSLLKQQPVALAC
jgi:flagellar protein FliS